MSFYSLNDDEVRLIIEALDDAANAGGPKYVKLRDRFVEDLGSGRNALREHLLKRAQEREGLT